MQTDPRTGHHSRKAAARGSEFCDGETDGGRLERNSRQRSLRPRTSTRVEGLRPMTRRSCGPSALDDWPDMRVIFRVHIGRKDGYGVVR